MRTTRLSRHVGLFTALVLLTGGAALAANGEDGKDGKDKKATTSHQKVKSEKPRTSPTVTKETPPAYPNLGAPTGY